MLDSTQTISPSALVKFLGTGCAQKKSPPLESHPEHQYRHLTISGAQSRGEEYVGHSGTGST
jgi:hypothetical protein